MAPLNDAELARAAVLEVWQETYSRPALPQDCEVSHEYREAFAAAANELPDATEQANELSLPQRSILLRTKRHRLSGTLIAGAGPVRMAERMRQASMLTTNSDGTPTSEPIVWGSFVFLTRFGIAVADTFSED